MITITANTGPIVAILRGIAARGKNPGPALKMAGLLIKRDIQRNFDESHTPEGERWAPLKRPRRRGVHARGGAHRGRVRAGARTGTDVKPLIDQGYLRNGINYEVGPHHVSVTTSAQTMAYAAAQNFGYRPRNLPARKYMGISAQAVTEITSTLERMLVKGA